MSLGSSPYHTRSKEKGEGSVAKVMGRSRSLRHLTPEVELPPQKLNGVFVEIGEPGAGNYGTINEEEDTSPQIPEIDPGVELPF